MNYILKANPIFLLVRMLEFFIYGSKKKGWLAFVDNLRTFCFGNEDKVAIYSNNIEKSVKASEHVVSKYTI